MSDRNFEAMRKAEETKPRKPVDDYLLACTDPWFNTAVKHPLPPPEKRRYADTSPYRGYVVATYTTPPKPVMQLGGLPIYAVYFVLDELGDPVLPGDACFFSPMLPFAAIDALRNQPDNEQALNRAMYCADKAQHKLPELLASLHETLACCESDDIDLYYSLDTFAAHIRKRLMEALGAWK